MPQINVLDGEIPIGDGTDRTMAVKIIQADSPDGLSTRIVIPAEAAPQLAAALNGNQPSIAIAQPGDVPPAPPNA